MNKLITLTRKDKTITVVCARLPAEGVGRVEIMTRMSYPSSPLGTHPSFAASGVYEAECNMCEREFRYTHHENEDYRYNGRRVGVRDVSDGSDLCLACATEVGLAED